MKIRLTFIWLVLLSKLSFAQEVSSPIEIEDHIEQLLLNKGEEADNQSYYELLLQFYNNPIAINSCNSSELSVLQLVTNLQIEKIINYRNINGFYNNKYELLAIESLSLEEIKNILPFLSFNKPFKLSTVLKETISLNSNYLLISGAQTLEKANGYVKHNFLGDPYQYNLRLKFVNPGHTSLGITVQKDAGELLFRTDSLYKGPDFYSFHYYIQNQGIVKQLALGDYKLQFGQGLLLGAGFLVGKNASSITSIQTTLKIQPYTSLSEFNFFRGAGTTINITDKLEISAFYSYKQKDASLGKINRSDANSLSTHTSVTSLRSDGLHRTYSEISAQHSVTEQVAGSAITYINNRIEIGVLALYNKFNIPFEPQPNLANIYKFRGKENYNLSVFGNYNYQNITLYGEAAQTLNYGAALNLGLIASLSKNIDFSFQYRNLDSDFHSFYGVSFVENSTLNNERGVYWGINIKLSPSLTVMGYFDMYKFPWLKSTIPKPGTGSDGLVRLSYKLKKSALFYTQLHTENKDRRITSLVVQESATHKLLKFVINFDYNLESSISFRSRVQWTKSYFDTDEIGILLYQDINVKVRRITLSARYAIFETDGFLSRQYMYEKGVLYSFSTPQFNGKGVRYYILSKYSPFKGLTLRAKWSQTIYYDRAQIGNGNTLIDGNKKTQVTIQLKFDF